MAHGHDDGHGHVVDDHGLREPVRSSHNDRGPVWARSRRRRSGGGPLVGLLVTLLALFGALTLILSIKERSAAEAGMIIDSWASRGWAEIKKLSGQAPEIAEEAAQETGEAAEKAGNALEAGAEKASDELKK